MIDWNAIDTVLLDMDGTLLDLYFDNHFWLHYLPQKYAEARHLSLEAAKTELFAAFARHRGTLNWYCLDFWREHTGLDIVALKRDLARHIGPRPGALEFLQRVKASGRRAVLVTNAHRDSLHLKLQHVPLDQYLDVLISSHDLGLPKEDPLFWTRLEEVLHYQRHRTLLIDDSLAVLRSAHRAGIAFTLGVCQPDSRGDAVDTAEFIGLDDFSRIFPAENT